MLKAIDFTSIITRPLTDSRELTRSPGLVVRTDGQCLQCTLRLGAARHPLLCSGARPLLVREAAHHSWGVLRVREEACTDGPAENPVAEAVVPSREPCFSGEDLAV
jgi:hypothetical protein